MVIFRESLKNKILPNLKLRDLQQVNTLGYMVALPRDGINSYVFATIHYITVYHNQGVNDGFWTFVHESVCNTSEELFDKEHCTE